MTTQKVKRKLAAILSADVEGYSLLMSDDEVTTIRTLTQYKEAMTDLIEQYRGRVVDAPGDNLLAEFASIVNAVQCAIEIQRELADRNEQLSEERRMQFRIGVTLGDIVEEQDRIYGEGVNIAARLESICESGSVCISRNAYDQVKNKVDIEFEYLGDHNAKNITEPLRIYKVKMESDTPLAMQINRLQSPDKPSIAVLPFNNISDDPEQRYFAEGISEDITTELSRFHSLFVISRNTSFTYRGDTIKAQQVGRELGVEYIVQGSVRKAANRVRVSVQLIAVETDHYVWAERYDRNMEDLLAIQDEITETIVSTLAGRIEAAGIERAKRKNTKNMAAYDYLLKGLDFHKSGRASKEDAAQAVEMLTKAVELDPEFARAQAWLACASTVLWYANPTPEQIDECRARVQKALLIDENESEAHRIMGAMSLHRDRKYDRAEYHMNKAVSLNPNDANTAAKVAELFSFTGRPQEAVASVKRAMSLNPQHPDWYWQEMGLALYVGGQYTEAINAFNRIANPVEFDHAYLAVCCVALGEIDQAKSHVADLRNMSSRASIRIYEKTQPYKNAADLERFIDALRKAGLK